MGMFYLGPQGAIIIHEVYEEGAACKDGRLWAGDQILEVQNDVYSTLTVNKEKANLGRVVLVCLFFSFLSSTLLIPSPSHTSSLSSTHLVPHSPCPTCVQVNGIDLRKATHDEAINVLRQTPQRVRLTLYRDETPYKEEDVYDTLTIELQKKPGKGLGLSIVGKR